MCDYENFCFEQIDGHAWGVAIEVVVFVYSFVGIALVADEHLTTSLETLCARWEIPTDVAGASFLALGSAAPEIVVAAVSTVKSVMALSAGEADLDGEATFASSLAISSILGSGWLAFLLIPGVCALVVPRRVELKRRPLARDAISYLIALVLLILVLKQGVAHMRNAVEMIALYAIYLVGTALAPWVRESYRVSFAGMEPRSSRRSQASSREGSIVNPMELGQKVELTKGLSAELSTERSTEAAGAEEEEEEEGGGGTAWYWAPFIPLDAILKATCPNCEEGSETETLYPLTFVVALLWLTLFSVCTPRVIGS